MHRNGGVYVGLIEIAPVLFYDKRALIQNVAVGRRGRNMRIAVCENAAAPAERLRFWIEQYCQCYHLTAVLRCFISPEVFSACREPFDIVYLGFGGNTGFLQARLLRERDRFCRIILIDDTQEFAVRCVRLHCTDFILRPVEFRHIVRSMDLALRGGMR